MTIDPDVTLQCRTNVGSNLTLLSGPFYRSNVKEVELKDGYTTVPAGLFARATQLQTVTLPDTVTSIGSVAFANSSNLQTVNLPDGVTDIGENAFYGCSNLTDIDIPSKLETIGEGAFMGSGLAGALNLPESVRSIGSKAFQSAKITSLNIAEGTKEVRIGAKAFNAYSLAEIHLPDNVRLDQNVFDSTSYYNDDSNWTQLDGTEGEENTALYIDNHLIKIGHAYFDVFEGEFTVRPGTVSIAGGAGRGTKITVLTIPETVRVIGNQAFYEIGTLTQIKFEGTSQLETIGENAFYRETALRGAYSILDQATFVIPASVKRIERGAFYGRFEASQFGGQNVGYKNEEGEFVTDEFTAEEVYKAFENPNGWQYESDGEAITTGEELRTALNSKATFIRVDA